MKPLLLVLVVLGGLLLYLLWGAGPSRGGLEPPGPPARAEAGEERRDGALEASSPVPDAPRRSESGRSDAGPGEVREPEPVPGARPGAPAEVTFHGLVLDGLTQRPIAGARIEVPPRKAAADGVTARTTSDDAGLFALEAQEERWGVVEADGHGPRPFFLDAHHATPERAAVIELLPAAALEVDVRTASGAPVAEARVVLVRTQASPLSHAFRGMPTQGVRFEGSTGELGTLLLEGLPAEVDLAWSVTPADGNEGAAGHVALAPGERRRLAAVLGGTARVFGHVRDEHGMPVADLGLSLSRKDAGGGGDALGKTRTDEGGAYQFDGVPFEALTLGLAGGAEEVLLPGPCDLVVDRPLVEHDLVVVPGLFLEGVVSASEEQRQELFWVNLSALDGTWLDSFDVGEGGRFRAGPVEAGEYLLAAPGFGFSTETVRAAAGERDIVLRVLEPRPLRFEAEGAPPPFDLSLRDEERGFLQFHEQDDARFEKRLSDGRYLLRLEAEGDFLGLLSFAVGPEPLPAEHRVRLEPGATLTIVHRALVGTRSVRVRVDGGTLVGSPWADSQLAAGAALEVLVPPRPLVVELLEGARVVAREELVPRPRERLRVVLEPR